MKDAECNREHSRKREEHTERHRGTVAGRGRWGSAARIEPCKNWQTSDAGIEAKMCMGSTKNRWEEAVKENKNGRLRHLNFIL